MDKAMTPTLDALVRELREAMAQATPGPWAWESIAEKSNEFAVGQAWDADGTPIDGKVPAGEWVEESIIRGSLVGMNESGHARFSDARYIALCSPANLARLLTALQQAQEWPKFLAKWLDYNHGKGESDRAWEEFIAQQVAPPTGGSHD